MANPVTAILNPKGDRILHYWVDEKQRLALSQIPLDEDKSPLLYADHGTPNGLEVTNQSIAVVYLRGLPVVFGKIAVADKTAVSLRLGQLSPIRNILTDKAEKLLFTTVVLPAFAAVSDSKDTAWLYYLLKDDSRTPPTELVEAYYTFGKLEGIGGVPGLSGSLQPTEKSRLAVIYIDKTNREIFYQRKGSDNQIFCLRVGGASKDPQHITDTDNAMDGTPIAATRTESGAVYVYYLSDKGRIQRATRESLEWKNSTGTMTKFKNMKAQMETQLAVVTTKFDGQQVNNLFYLAHEETEETDGYKLHVDQDDIV